MYHHIQQHNLLLNSKFNCIIAKTLGYRLAIKICKSNLIVDMNFEVVIDIMLELNMIDHSTVTKLSTTSDENLKKEYVIYLLGSCEEDKLKIVLTKAKESEQLKQFVDQIEQRRCIGKDILFFSDYHVGCNINDFFFALLIRLN